MAARHAGWAAIAAGGLGLAVLLARPRGSITAVLATAGVGLIGLILPVPSGGPRPRVGLWQVIVVTFIGVAAFFAARLTINPILVPVSAAAILDGVVAALAEEAFFRRLLYGWLERWGGAAAIGCAAALFAAVHLPTYGWAAMPIDVTAGILFGWQRWASGTWLAPAVTHVVANLLQMG